MKRAVIFCSANYDIDPQFNDAAKVVVKLLCSKGYEIVSGGTVKGTMGVVSDTVVECGGYHRGVIPRFMENVLHPGLDEVVWTDTMSERKEAMREGTDLAIALPGGIGTMDELVETATLAKLNIYKGKVIVMNVKGFYNSLRDLFDHFVQTNMLYQKDRDLICFVDNFDELEALL